MLKNIMTDLTQFNKFKIVALFLDSKKIPEVKITEIEIKNKIFETSQNIDTIDLGAKKISENIKIKNIFIHPPKTRDSKEITQFASVIKDNLSKYLNTVTDPTKANYYLKGTYDILKNGIDLTYQLLDRDFNIINTYMVKLTPKAYENYDYEPKNLDFTKILEQGLVITNDFKIDIRTNYGKDDLIFKEGEEVEIFVKMNRPGYFYCVGHVNKKEEKYSYLLEINPDSQANRKFIFLMNDDDVNKWVSIGSFEISKPFGLESLQFIASKQDLVNSVPYNIYDNSLGYYILSSEPEKNVVVTRGLKPKKTSKEELGAENILLFTTIKK